jgi:hypothetical protein
MAGRLGQIGNTSAVPERGEKDAIQGSPAHDIDSYLFGGDDKCSKCFNT